MFRKITAGDTRGLQGILDDCRNYGGGKGKVAYHTEGVKGSKKSLARPDYVPPNTVSCDLGCTSVTQNHEKFVKKAAEAGFSFIPVTHTATIKL